MEMEMIQRMEMVMEKESNSGVVMRIEWKFLGLNGMRMEIRNYFQNGNITACSTLYTS
jgi:hypothetical protein